jgi:hypothetical protein
MKAVKVTETTGSFSDISPYEPSFISGWGSELITFEMLMPEGVNPRWVDGKLVKGKFKITVEYEDDFD